MTPDMTTKDAIKALRTVAMVLEQERDVMDDFHSFAQQYGGTPGCNVFQFAMESALAQKGMTLAQFRAQREPA